MREAKMTKKKMILVYVVVAIIYFIACGIPIAVSEIPNVPDKYVNYSMVLWFALSIINLIILFTAFSGKNYNKLLEQGLDAKAAKFRASDNYIEFIPADETMSSLEEKFKNKGYKIKDGVMVKKKFSWRSDFANHILVTRQSDDFQKTLDEFYESPQEFISEKLLRRKIGCIYFVIFCSDLSDKETEEFKNRLIEKESYYVGPALPIIYDTDKKRYIIRGNVKGTALYPFATTARNFRKIVL